MDTRFPSRFRPAQGRPPWPRANPAFCSLLLGILLIGLVPRPGSAQVDTMAVQIDSKAAPAASPSGGFGHYAVQTLVGAAAGWGAGLGLGFAASKTIGDQGGEDPGLEGFVTGFPVGFLLGTGLAVGLTARAQGEPYSYGGAFLGVLAGGGLTIALISPLQHSPLLYAVGFLLPATTAVVGSRLLSHPVQPVVSPTGNGQVAAGLSFRF